MKRILFSFLLFAAILPGFAQESRRPSHEIQLSAGTYSYGSGVQEYFQLGLLSMRLSYGLDIPVAENWSVIPEIGAKFYWEGVFAIGAVGADFDGFTYWDLTVSGRYHTADGIILGLGPMLSYARRQDHYYIDADPWDPLNGQPKNTRFNLSLRPSVLFGCGKHWHLGAEAEIGLTNAMVQYPELHHTGTRHLHALRFVACYRF